MNFKEIILEDKRAKILSDQKQGRDYVPQNQHKGKNRYQRRLKSKIKSSISHFNNIDMNKFFKDDILDVSLDVQGETNNYVVRMSFYGTLDELHNFINNGDQFDRKSILKALTRAFNRDDVYFRCSCADFCLHPSTEIKLLNGEIYTIEELCKLFNDNDEMWVYSTDDRGDFKPGKVEDIWISNYTSEFIKITLDNNEEILTTPNHIYMLRDGSYLEAKDLKLNQSLMPMYFSYHSGYENYKVNSETYPTKFKSVYKEVANTCLHEEIEEAKERSGEQYIAIHHVDYNKLNNYPSNLKPMGVQEHWEWHYRHIKESGTLEKFLEGGKKYWSTSEAKEKQSKQMFETITKYYANRTPDEVKRDAEIRSKNTKKAWQEGKFDTLKFKNAAKRNGEFLHTPEMEKLSAEGVQRYWDNLIGEEREKRLLANRISIEKAAEVNRGKPKSKKTRHKMSLAALNKTPEQKINHNIKIRDTKIITVLNKILADGKEITFEEYDNYRPGGYPAIRKHFKNEKELIDYYKLDDRYNHKIINIEYISLDEKIPVYDIQIKDYNNFLVNAGVVLHNCYRHSYWATKNDLIIGDKETRPNRFDHTNKDNDMGPACKHITLALTDSSWLIKVASVIYNYVNYMEDHQERMYQKFIYPAIYQQPWVDETQLDITDIEGTDELDTDSGTIAGSNAEARKKGQFKPGNEYRFRKEPTDDGEQQEIDL